MSRWSNPSVKWQVITDSATLSLSLDSNIWFFFSWPKCCGEWDAIRGGEGGGGGEEGEAQAVQVRCGCVEGDLGCYPLLFCLLPLFPRQDVSEPKSPRVVVNKIDEALRREPIKTKDLNQQHKTIKILTLNKNLADEPRKAKPYLLSQVSTRW